MPPQRQKITDDQQLQTELQRLQKEVLRLMEENTDLKSIVSIVTEHGDEIFTTLYQKLTTAIAMQQQAEQLASQLLKEKQDLEIVLENVTQHSDLLEEKLLEKNQVLEILVETITEHGDTVEAEAYDKAIAASQLAITDSLTQVANRRYFDLFLSQTWEKLLLIQKPLSLLLCDVDHFKVYNDRYGHQQGDVCLYQVAQALKQSARRPNDLVARYGGEEFALILPETDQTGAIHLAELILSEVERLKIPHVASMSKPYVTISIGVGSVLPNALATPYQLLEMVDEALYLAKRQGRDRYCIASASDATLRHYTLQPSVLPSNTSI